MCSDYNEKIYHLGIYYMYLQISLFCRHMPFVVRNYQLIY